MAKASKSKKITINRSAKTGRFVTKDYDAKHKSTTETEHYKANKK
jgi:hypothetical protein